VANLLDRLPEPDPDWRRLDAVLRRRGEGDRVPLVELFADVEIMASFLDVPAADFGDSGDAGFRLYGEFAHRVGFDYLSRQVGLRLEWYGLDAADTAALARDKRSWMEEHKGPVATRRGYRDYKWPRPGDLETAGHEWCRANVPKGMSVIGWVPGICESVTWLMGYESFCYALVDDAALVGYVASRCADLLYAATEYVASQPDVMAVWSSDDMGFKNQPFASPEVMRKYFLSVHKRMAETAHAAGKPYMLHSCGNLEMIMEDLIEDVGVDAKHSFEDVIEPVADFKRRYGGRIAALGGVDMDVLARRSPEHVRTYTRKVLEACAPGGGFAIGSGNTVANYIPPENYLAMLLEWNAFSGR